MTICCCHLHRQKCRSACHWKRRAWQHPRSALAGTKPASPSQSRLFLFFPLHHPSIGPASHTCIIYPSHNQPTHPSISIQHQQHADDSRPHRPGRHGPGWRPNQTSLVSLLSISSGHDILLTGHSEFSLTAYGASVKAASGVVGQLYDGQNRIGQCNLPIPKAKYSLDSAGRESHTAPSHRFTR